MQKIGIHGYAFIDEKDKFYKGGKSIVVYKQRMPNMSPMTYSKTDVFIEEFSNYWVIKRKYN